MNEEKISSDEVPQRFTEWLLSMGCPPEKVPSVSKISEMCRGQYYMVWRSLMEHVEAKDVIRQKRLQVFCDDVLQCEKKVIAYKKKEITTVVPEELACWRQQTELQKKVAAAEARVQQARQDLNQLTQKISSKLSQRITSQQSVQDAHRRGWLLQQVGEELKAKRDNLLETKTIADSLCCIEEIVDVQAKLEKCLPVLVKARGLPTTPANSTTDTSTLSESPDTEEQVSSLVRSRGDVLFNLLCERRSALCTEMAQKTARESPRIRRVTPQMVLSHTASLQCTLALEAVKNRVNVKQTRARLATAVAELGNNLSGDACELLVVRCEKARAEARTRSLKGLLGELASQSGAFEAGGPGSCGDSNSIKQITVLDKAIESKRDEIRQLMSAALATERKVANVKECLVAVFNSFHGEGQDKFEGPSSQLSVPRESIPSLRQYYAERREKRRSKMELSLDFDGSDNGSFVETFDTGSPKFTDELKIYLNKFKLEKNRKLVLENGEKIWIFETLDASLARIYGSLQPTDNSPLCPSVRISAAAARLHEDLQTRDRLTAVLDAIGAEKELPAFDIPSTEEEEEKTIDKIKKRLNENLLGLQKTNKTLEVGRENLNFWSENNLKKHIANTRVVEGKTFVEYEEYYLESLTI